MFNHILSIFTEMISKEAVTRCNFKALIYRIRLSIPWNLQMNHEIALIQNDMPTIEIRRHRRHHFKAQARNRTNLAAGVTQAGAKRLVKYVCGWRTCRQLNNNCRESISITHIPMVCCTGTIWTAMLVGTRMILDVEVRLLSTSNSGSYKFRQNNSTFSRLNLFLTFPDIYS